MIGMGTLINTAAVAAGGIIGHFTGRLFKAEQQDALTKACGVSVLFIAIAGAMEGMLQIQNGAISGGKSMLAVLSIAAGAIVGECIGIEDWFERFGKWLKFKTGNGGEGNFVNAFVTASLTVCIGAMAIVGAIQDGILGDYSTLTVKSVLDFIIIAVMTSSMGKGAIFSAIPIFALEGSVTLLARLIAPVMTDLAIAYLSLIGSILIFCVGVNLVWGKTIRVANLLPSLIFAVAAAYLFTVVVEAPFVWLAFRGGDNCLKRVVKASFVVQGASYVVLFGFYSLLSVTSLLDVKVVDAASMDIPDNLTLKYQGRNGRWYAGDLRSREWKETTAANAKDYEEKFGANFRRQVRAIGKESAEWECELGFWPRQGIKCSNKKTGKVVKLAFETPFLMWFIDYATQLPDGKVLFCILPDQICVADPGKNQIAVLARGQKPIVEMK